MEGGALKYRGSSGTVTPIAALYRYGAQTVPVAEIRYRLRSKTIRLWP